jgi:hypothetical protein
MCASRGGVGSPIFEGEFTAGASFVGRDAAKLLFPEFLENPTANNRFADGAASAVADAVRRTLLAGPVRAGRDRVVLLTGAPASGKTGSVGPNYVDRVDFEHETILTSDERSHQLVEEILVTGRIPILRLFYTDDPGINAERMVRRAMRIGRTVPLRYMAETYVGVPERVRRLQTVFGQRLTVRVTNNSESPDKAVHHNRIQRAIYHVSRYTQESALEAMLAKFDEISEAIPGLSAAIL